MSVDLLVLDHRAETIVLSTGDETICRIVLQPGETAKPFLVLAKGEVSVVAGEITLALRVLDDSDETSFNHTNGQAPFETGRGTFSLMLVTTLPPDPGPDPDLFAAATLTGRRSGGGGLGSVRNVKLVAIPIANVTAVPG